MRIVVAMSGGVDSSVAAYELKKQGHEVIGVTMKTWPKEECGTVGEKLCCSLEAIQIARSVSEDLDIPFYVMDFSSEFSKIVKEYFAREYSKGRTPNPCIFCNSKLKFGLLLDRARELGAEKIATGHYARIIKKNNEFFLAEGKNSKRDQTYFLYDIPRGNLGSIEFPIGEYDKEKVREIAYKEGFLTADRPASQDICFTTQQGDYREYLSKINDDMFSPGDILDTSGKIVGKHKGIAAYTVGQRKGIGVYGPNPVYVVKIDPEKKTITVGAKEEAMYKKIKVAQFNWLTMDKLNDERTFETRIRYNSKKVEARVSPLSEDEAMVEFEVPQFAPTPGQAAVFYEEDIVAGGGWIEEIVG